MSNYALGTARGRIEVDASGVSSGVERAERAVDGLADGVRRSSGRMAGFGAGLAAFGAAVAGAFGVAVGQAATFERRMDAVAAVSGATNAQMTALSDKALQLGQDTGFTATEVADALEELVQSGLSVDDVLSGAANATVALAAAGGTDLPTAAGIATTAMNTWNLAASELPRVADLLAGAANASAISVENFGQSVAQVGAMAALVGLSFQDTAVAVAALGNAGIRGSDAGNSLKTLLANLQPSSEAATKAMRELGLLTEDGANAFFTAEGELKPLRDVQQLLHDATAGLTDAEKTLALETIFGRDAVRAAAVLAEDGAAGYDAFSTAVAGVTAESVAQQRLGNVAGQWGQVKGAAQSAAIEVGERLLPALAALLTGVATILDWLNDLGPTTTQVLATFVGVAGAIYLLAGVAGQVAGAFVTFLAALAPLAALLGVTAGALFGWLLLLPLLVAAVVALVVLVVANWDRIVAWTMETWGGLRDWLAGLWASVAAAVSGTVGRLVEAVTGGWERHLAAWRGVWTTLREAALAAWTAVVGVLDSVASILADVLSAAFAPFAVMRGRFSGQ